MSDPKALQTRFAPYREALKALSARTGTPLPSLIASFVIVHELTALVPLAGFFLTARTLGVGERVVDFVKRDDLLVAGAEGEIADPGVVKRKFREWFDEGERWASRVGVRYGVFGFEKGQAALPPRHRAIDAGGPFTSTDVQQTAHVADKVAGEVANAIVAYGATKALLPVRIGFSMYLAPGFSRRIVEPLRANIARMFWRKRSSGSS